MADYYTFVFIVNKKKYFCIWFTDDKDGFIVDSDKIKIFNEIDHLKHFAQESSLRIGDEISELSIDYAKDWLDRNEKRIDCRYFLNFWNTISDLAFSVKASFNGDNKNRAINKIYDKLFWGNNLPAVTPEGKEYIPKWTKKEIEELKKVVRDGLALIDLHLIESK